MSNFEQKAIRQFRHNFDNSPGHEPAAGFVFAYDKEETDKEIERLRAQIAKLEEAGDELASILDAAYDGDPYWVEAIAQWHRAVAHSNASQSSF